jgi:hypothetical protein
LTANAAAIASWVNGGGRLLINAAPNTGGNINFGFGVTLNYNGGTSQDDGPTSTPNPSNPIFAGPVTPVSTSYTGTHFSHAYLTGPLTPVIQDSGGRTVFGTLVQGSGFVGFGGMTTDNFHSPKPQAHNLVENIIAYVSGSGIYQVPAIPTLQTGVLVLLAALLGVLAMSFVRRRQR